MKPERFVFGFYSSSEGKPLASGPIPVGSTTENMLKFIEELRNDVKPDALVYLVPGLVAPETATEAFVAETKWRNRLARDGLETFKAKRGYGIGRKTEG